MSCVLFYSPFNQRSRDTESLMIGFKQQGHRVISLSQASGAQIHEFVEARGIETYSFVVNGSGLLFFLRHLIYFVRFCYKHKVDVVYSHLESANFVASIAQFLIRAKVFICRHHIDEALLYGFDRSVSYRLTYSLARRVIVVSERARQFMIRHEKMAPEKILVINLAYNFELFRIPNQREVKSMREAIGSDVLLLTVSRLTEFKRPQLSIDVLREVLKKNIDAKLIFLGRGEEEANLKAIVDEGGLGNRVSFAGYVSNVTDYLSAADFLLHPSILESSCVAVKEAALCHLPVIVCKEVGDFEDYLVNGENAFLTGTDNFVTEAASVIISNHGDRTKLGRMTDNLSTIVRDRFNLNSIISQYDLLNKAK